MSDTTITTDAATGPEASARGTRLPSLRAALAIDAVVTAGNGLAYLIAAGPLGELLGISPDLLRGVGAFLVAFAAVVALTARPVRPLRAPAVAIVAVNALWALDSLVAAAAGWGSPTVAGTVWIALQGMVVGALAGLQGRALRDGARRR